MMAASIWSSSVFRSTELALIPVLSSVRAEMTLVVSVVCWPLNSLMASCSFSSPSFDQ